MTQVLPIELAGRGRRLREPPQSDLVEIATEAAAALAPMCARPFAIFGHSMGATVGFEIARLLEKRYACVAQHLIVAAASAPQLKVDEPITFDLPEHEFLQHVCDIGATPSALFDDEELRALFVPRLRADFQATETYQYRHAPPLSCPITALGGLADPDVSRDQLCAWRAQTHSAFACRLLPGDHFFITHRAEDCLAAVADALWPPAASVNPPREMSS